MASKKTWQPLEAKKAPWDYRAPPPLKAGDEKPAEEDNADHIMRAFRQERQVSRFELDGDADFHQLPLALQAMRLPASEPTDLAAVKEALRPRVHKKPMIGQVLEREKLGRHLIVKDSYNRKDNTVISLLARDITKASCTVPYGDVTFLTPTY
eukprot:TRINITY_DN72199_c0_g1_i1.p1 TRINITY_DN72199_c0_g1~~TRINITY_DN72199_c0_g1_i1.p1  ORF type:complete len:153 (-),score=39.59 TRINITY_DN72199_c0_g1_i1:41-499(-)